MFRITCQKIHQRAESLIPRLDAISASTSPVLLPRLQFCFAVLGHCIDSFPKRHHPRASFLDCPHSASSHNILSGLALSNGLLTLRLSFSFSILPVSVL